MDTGPAPGAAGGEPPAAPVTGLSHVQLQVADLDRSVAWYRTVLGVVPFAGDPAVGYVALRHAAARMVIVLSRSDPVRGPVETGPPPAGRVDHLAFAVPDGEVLRAWAAHLTASGIDHPGVVLEGDNPSLQLRDPDGIAVELVAPGR